MTLGCGAKQQKRCWQSGKIAKFAFFTAGSQPTECAVQQGISDFLTADEKTYTGSSVQTVDVPIEFEFLGILMLLK